MNTVARQRGTELRAGFAQADITPRGKCDLNGFAARIQPLLGVGRPVCARVLLLAHARRSVLVASCDLLGFTLADSRRIEMRMAAEAGIAAESVFLACTHTHSGPMSMPLGRVGRFRRGYVDFVGQRLVAATRAAMGNLAEVAAAVLGDQEVAQLGRFRCARDEPGRDRWPGRITALRLDRVAAPPLTLVHLGVHPCVLGPKNRRLHPDYPGEVCDLLARATRGHALFLPGCGADVEAVPAGGASFAQVRRYARQVVTAALAALRTGAPINLTPLGVGTVSPLVSFGYGLAQGREVAPLVRDAHEQVRDRLVRNWHEWREDVAQGRCPRRLNLRAHLLRLGDIMLIGLPAEVFHDTGADLTRALAGWRILTVSHTGGVAGYLPRSFAYRRRTYEAVSAHQWYRTAGAMLPGMEAYVRRRIVSVARRLLRDERGTATVRA